MKVYFHTKEEFEKETNVKIICAMALNNWACCTLEKPPADFGEGMAIAGQKMQIIATPDNVRAFAETIT